MKIFICSGFVFMLFSHVNASCNDVCMTSMTKSCADTCIASCSNDGSGYSTSASGTEVGTSASVQEQTSTMDTSPAPARVARDIAVDNLPQRPDRVIFSAADKDLKLPFRQDVLMSRDEPIKDNHDRASRHVPSRFVRDINGPLPERPNKVIFGNEEHVKLPTRQDALLNRDRFVRDINEQLPERPDRIIFGNVGNIQLPTRQDALKSRDLPIPDSADNGNGNGGDQSQQQLLPASASQTSDVQSQCQPRCNSACMAQVSTVCQQLCNHQTA